MRRILRSYWEKLETSLSDSAGSALTIMQVQNKKNLMMESKRTFVWDTLTEVGYIGPAIQ